MHTKNAILHNTLEGMLADADDHGRDTIHPTLSHDDVIDILNALAFYDDQMELLHAVSEAKTATNEFSDTIDGMMSPDYKERFKAEYQQTKIRYDKLHAMLVKADAGTLNFKPSCPLDLLREQKAFMGKYLYCLEVRAQIEGVELN